MRPTAAGREDGPRLWTPQSRLVTSDVAPGDLVCMRYLGLRRWARVAAVTACRVYLTTETLPSTMRPLRLAWVRPERLTAIVMKGNA